MLGLDSAGTACSAGLWWDDRLISQSFERMSEGQAESLIPMIASVMGTVSLRELDAVAVTVGPGSFTGIRIGLAAARGIALAAGIEVVGATTLEAVAHGVDVATDEILLVALESKRAELFVQCFDSGRTPITEPSSILPDALALNLPAGRLRAAGDGRGRAVAACGQAGRAIEVLCGPDQPQGATVARLAADRLGRGQPLLPAVPIYLRAPDVRAPVRPSSS
ncbi:MAG: tRNA (adenosine(37)-N6)-threonylcarbamoyltransferase complex dimerization subunit type 1 TsaB [Alphaproteobacteria bacterium]